MVKGYEMRKHEYALVSWHTCPSCSKIRLCALASGDYIFEFEGSIGEVYKCPNCGYVGRFDPRPSGFAEYRKEESRGLGEGEPLWPLTKEECEKEFSR